MALFISYTIETKDGKAGFCHCTTDHPAPQTHADFAELVRRMTEESGAAAITILNWIALPTPTPQETQ